MRIDVTCSTDDKYVQHCCAMLCSLFENNKEHKVIVYLLHHGLSNDSQELLHLLADRYENEIICHDVNPDVFDGVELNPTHTWLSKAAFYRFLIPEIAPSDVNRVLYLDCDIIVLSDISPLFKLAIDEYGIAAIKDSSPFERKHRDVMGLELDDRAFCSGMMMINLAYWREHNCQQQLFDYARKEKDNLVMEDQDILNFVFRKKWFQLPYKYGKTPLTVAPVDKNQRWFDIYEFVYEPCIYHYAAHVKPWLDVWFPDKHYYWEYVKISGFPNPKKTHANRQLRIRIYKSVTRFIINKYIRPFIPEIVEILLKDIYNIILFTLNILRPKRFKDMMLKRWCQKYGMMK